MQTSYVYHIQNPFFLFFLREWRGSEGLRGLGVFGYAFFCKILPETKSSSSQCTLLFFLFFFLVSQKTEVKRNVQKFHVLTFWKEKIVRKHCYLKENDFLNLYLGIRVFLFLPSTFPKDGLLFLYTSAFWLFSSTFSSSFFSSSEEPLSFSPVFQLPCLFRIKHFFF